MEPTSSRSKQALLLFTAVGLLCVASLVFVGQPQKVLWGGKLEKRLPQAIIVGVKKGGTRALLEYLRVHPLVRAPGPEIHFFDRFYDRGLEWYRSQMPETTGDHVTLEKTPSYFIKREVPPRVHAMNANIKLLVVVRDPVTRAISDYTQAHSKGKTDRRFDDMAFLDRLHLNLDEKWSAVRIGLYAKHLKKWLPYFALGQIHFVSGERLIADPVEEMRNVEAFLNLPPYIGAEHFNFNQTKGFPCVKKHPQDESFRCLGKTKGRAHPEVSERTLRRLRRFYAPQNEAFFELVGRDFGWNSRTN